MTHRGFDWRQPRLLLCALLLILGAAELGVSLKARIAGSTAAPVNIEARGRTASVAPDTDEPAEPITNEVKSSTDTTSPPLLSPAPPNEQLLETQGPTRLAASDNEMAAVAQTPTEGEAKGARTKSRARVRRARLFAHQQMAETEELQQIHASIRRPFRYGRCWLNNHQADYHWGNCSSSSIDSIWSR